jgi:hypothetical protein
VKTENEIRKLAEDLLRRDLSDRLAQSSRVLPCNCKYNHKHPLDTRKKVLGCGNSKYNTMDDLTRTIGLCMYGAEDPETWPGTICEDDVDAQRCPTFSPLKPSQEVTQEFKSLVQDLDWLEVNIPKVWALYWTIEQRTPISIPSPPAGVWQRTWCALRNWVSSLPPFPCPFL